MDDKDNEQPLVVRPLVEQLIEAIKTNENNARTRLREALGIVD